MLVHIAGEVVEVNARLRQRLRQRCAWCGAVLIDYDLTRIAVPEGTDPRPATWVVGCLVGVDGAMKFGVEYEDGQPLPDDACAVLDVESD